MDYELRRMMTSSVTFNIRANSTYGPGTPTVVGPVDAYVEESKRTTSKQGQTKQGQVTYEAGTIVLDPADDATIGPVLTAEVAEVILSGGSAHRIESVSTFYDPETGLVDHYELTF